MKKWNAWIITNTAAGFTSMNPVLQVYQLGYETDTGRVKWGDGVTAWASLGYFGEGGGGSQTWQQTLSVAGGSDLTQDNTIFLDSTSLVFDRDGANTLELTPGGVSLGDGNNTYLGADFNSQTIELSAGDEESNISLFMDFPSGTFLLSNGKVGIGSTPSASQLKVAGLQNFATNADAITGGLSAGDFYYTNTAGQAVLKVVI